MSPGVRRVGPLVFAFLLGVGVTVGAYEITRVVRDARQALALASGRVEPDVPPVSSGERSRTAPRGARTEAVSRPDGQQGARQSRRQRAQRVAQRRKALGSSGELNRSAGGDAEVRRARQARRDQLEALVPGVREGPAQSGERDDTGR